MPNAHVAVARQSVLIVPCSGGAALHQLKEPRQAPIPAHIRPQVPHEHQPDDRHGVCAAMTGRAENAARKAEISLSRSRRDRDAGRGRTGASGDLKKGHGEISLRGAPTASACAE